MTDAELERLRPPHVTMGAMRLWRLTHYARMSAILAFAVTLFCVAIVDGLRPLLAAAGGLLALALLAWFLVVAFVFLRYSLRTMMQLILVSAALITLCVIVPASWIFPPVLVSAIWFSILFFLIVGHDPKVSAKNHGYPMKPAQKEQEPFPDPRA